MAFGAWPFCVADGFASLGEVAGAARIGSTPTLGSGSGVDGSSFGGADAGVFTGADGEGWPVPAASVLDEGSGVSAGGATDGALVGCGVAVGLSGDPEAFGLGEAVGLGVGVGLRRFFVDVFFFDFFGVGVGVGTPVMICSSRLKNCGSSVRPLAAKSTTNAAITAVRACRFIARSSKFKQLFLPGPPYSCGCRLPNSRVENSRSANAPGN